MNSSMTLVSRLFMHNAMLGHTHYENLDVYFAYHHTVRNIVRSGTFPNDDNMQGNALKKQWLLVMQYASDKSFYE